MQQHQPRGQHRDHQHRDHHQHVDNIQLQQPRVQPTYRYRSYNTNTAVQQDQEQQHGPSNVLHVTLGPAATPRAPRWPPSRCDAAQGADDVRGGQHPASRAHRAGAGTPRNVWTILERDGPKHLGIVVQRAPWASNSPDHLGLRALQGCLALFLVSSVGLVRTQVAHHSVVPRERPLLNSSEALLTVTPLCARRRSPPTPTGSSPVPVRETTTVHAGNRSTGSP